MRDIAVSLARRPKETRTAKLTHASAPRACVWQADGTACGVPLIAEAGGGPTGSSRIHGQERAVAA